MAYTFPSNDLQRPATIRTLLGSLWTNIYDGRQLLDDRIRARAELSEHNHKLLLEAEQAVSRLTVPIWHIRDWYPFFVLESTLNANDAALWRFDDPDLPTFNGSPEFQFDTPLASDEYTLELPVGVQDVPLVTNRLTDPSVVLTQNIDYRLVLDRRGIVFRENPFDNELFAVRNVYQNNVITDRELLLWFFRSRWDKTYVHSHFGYVIGLELDSSEAYRDFVNCVMDAIAGGTSLAQLQCLVSLMADIPIVQEREETVADVRSDHTYLLVNTDQHVYKHVSTATATVAAEDDVKAGTSLIDGLTMLEPNRGQTLAALKALVLGKGLLSNDFRGELIFENKDETVTVTGIEGQERVEFTIGGHPLDVDLFWDTVHDRRLTYGQSLHQLLQAEPGAFPATINPMEFLLENVFRNNAVVFRLKAADFGDDALGLGPSAFVRRIMPPHTTTILVIELAGFSDSVNITNVDDGTFSTFDGMEPLSQDVGSAAVDDTCFTVKNVSFTCQ